MNCWRAPWISTRTTSSPTQEPSRTLRERYLSLIARRAGGEPFPFLMGFIEFWGLELKVKPGAFVPRPSSELTVELAVDRLKRKKSPVVDRCVHGGRPDRPCDRGRVPQGRRVRGRHLGGGARARAPEREATRHQEREAHGRRHVRRRFRRSFRGRSTSSPVTFPTSTWMRSRTSPPRCGSSSRSYTLSDQSGDGLDLMRRAVFESIAWLKPGGWLLLETAEDLGSKIKKMFHKAGFEKVRRQDGRGQAEHRHRGAVEGPLSPGAPGSRGKVTHA